MQASLAVITAQMNTIFFQLHRIYRNLIVECSPSELVNFNYFNPTIIQALCACHINQCTSSHSSSHGIQLKYVPQVVLGWAN